MKLKTSQFIAKKKKKKSGHQKRQRHKLTHFRHLQPSKQLSNVFLIPKDRAPRKQRGCFQSCLLTGSETPLSRLGMNLSALFDTGATILELNPTVIKHPLSCSTKIVQIVGIANKPQLIIVSVPIPFCLGFLKDIQHFSQIPLPLFVLEKYAETPLPKGGNNSRI